MKKAILFFNCLPILILGMDNLLQAQHVAQISDSELISLTSTFKDTVTTKHLIF